MMQDLFKWVYFTYKHASCCTSVGNSLTAQRLLAQKSSFYPFVVFRKRLESVMRLHGVLLLIEVCIITILKGDRLFGSKTNVV